MSTSRAILLETTESFIALFTQPFPPPAAALALRTPDCKHYIGPSVPNLTFASNEESVASWAGVQWAFKNYRFALIDARRPVVDVEARRVVFWVKGTADTVVGPYEHDIVFMLAMDADGRRIEEIVEICDSAYVADWMDRFGSEDFQRRSLEWQAMEGSGKVS